MNIYVADFLTSNKVFDLFEEAALDKNTNIPSLQSVESVGSLQSPNDLLERKESLKNLKFRKGSLLGEFCLLPPKLDLPLEGSNSQIILQYSIKAWNRRQDFLKKARATSSGKKERDLSKLIKIKSSSKSKKPRPEQSEEKNPFLDESLIVDNENSGLFKLKEKSFSQNELIRVSKNDIVYLGYYSWKENQMTRKGRLSVIQPVCVAQKEILENKQISELLNSQRQFIKYSYVGELSGNKFQGPGILKSSNLLLLSKDFSSLFADSFNLLVNKHLAIFSKFREDLRPSGVTLLKFINQRERKQLRKRDLSGQKSFDKSQEEMVSFLSLYAQGIPAGYGRLFNTSNEEENIGVFVPKNEQRDSNEGFILTEGFSFIRQTEPPRAYLGEINNEGIVDGLGMLMEPAENSGIEATVPGFKELTPLPQFCNQKLNILVSIFDAESGLEPEVGEKPEPKSSVFSLLTFPIKNSPSPGFGLLSLAGSKLEGISLIKISTFKFRTCFKPYFSDQEKSPLFEPYFCYFVGQYKNNQKNGAGHLIIVNKTRLRIKKNKKKAGEKKKESQKQEYKKSFSRAVLSGEWQDDQPVGEFELFVEGFLNQDPSGAVVKGRKRLKVGLEKGGLEEVGSEARSKEEIAGFSKADKIVNVLSSKLSKLLEYLNNSLQTLKEPVENMEKTLQENTGLLDQKITEINESLGAEEQEGFEYQRGLNYRKMKEDPSLKPSALKMDKFFNSKMKSCSYQTLKKDLEILRGVVKPDCSQFYSFGKKETSDFNLTSSSGFSSPQNQMRDILEPNKSDPNPSKESELDQSDSLRKKVFKTSTQAVKTVTRAQKTRKRERMRQAEVFEEFEPELESERPLETQIKTQPCLQPTEDPPSAVPTLSRVILPPSLSVSDSPLKMLTFICQNRQDSLLYSLIDHILSTPLSEEKEKKEEKEEKMDEGWGILDTLWMGDGEGGDWVGEEVEEIEGESEEDFEEERKEKRGERLERGVSKEGVDWVRGERERKVGTALLLDKAFADRPAKEKSLLGKLYSPQKASQKPILSFAKHTITASAPLLPKPKVLKPPTVKATPQKPFSHLTPAQVSPPKIPPPMHHPDQEEPILPSLPNPYLHPLPPQYYSCLSNISPSETSTSNIGASLRSFNRTLTFQPSFASLTKPLEKLQKSLTQSKASNQPSNELPSTHSLQSFPSSICPHRSIFNTLMKKERVRKERENMEREDKESKEREDGERDRERVEANGGSNGDSQTGEIVGAEEEQSVIPDVVTQDNKSSEIQLEDDSPSVSHKSGKEEKEAALDNSPESNKNEPELPLSKEEELLENPILQPVFLESFTETAYMEKLSEESDRAFYEEIKEPEEISNISEIQKYEEETEQSTLIENLQELKENEENQDPEKVELFKEDQELEMNEDPEEIEDLQDLELFEERKEEIQDLKINSKPEEIEDIKQLEQFEENIQEDGEPNTALETEETKDESSLKQPVESTEENEELNLAQEPKEIENNEELQLVEDEKVELQDENQVQEQAKIEDPQQLEQLDQNKQESEESKTIQEPEEIENLEELELSEENVIELQDNNLIQKPDEIEDLEQLDLCEEPNLVAKDPEEIKDLQQTEKLEETKQDCKEPNIAPETEEVGLLEEPEELDVHSEPTETEVVFEDLEDPLAQKSVEKPVSAVGGIEESLQMDDLDDLLLEEDNLQDPIEAENDKDNAVGLTFHPPENIDLPISQPPDLVQPPSLPPVSEEATPYRVELIDSGETSPSAEKKEKEILDGGMKNEDGLEKELDKEEEIDLGDLDQEEEIDLDSLQEGGEEGSEVVGMGYKNPFLGSDMPE